MRYYHSSILRSIAQLSFSVPLLGRLLRHWTINRRYSNERKVLRGHHISRSGRQSIVFFTLHRSGSSFIGRVLNKISREAGLVPVDLDGYFFQRGEGKVLELGSISLRKLDFQKNGYYYGPFRSFFDSIRNLDDFKVILVLRDPRDVLVSGFFSAYSHPHPLMDNAKRKKDRQERREQWLNLGIDRYILQKLRDRPNYLDRYREYFEHVLGKPNVLFLKYEEMVLHFDSWLENVLEYLDLEISPQLRHEIMDESGCKVDQENIHIHKRQVRPGDYLRKLEKGTIDFMNVQAKDILKKLNY